VSGLMWPPSRQGGVDVGNVRFGIIGLRRGKSFARVCAAVPGAEVTALHDIDVERLEGAASELDVRAFESLEDMLACDEVDCVVIASPLPVHAEQAVLALEAGKHVLSEVTACSTLEQARALVAAAEESSAVYMMAENYRYLDEVELVRRLYADGRFGRVYFGEGEYLHDCRELWHSADGSLTWRGRGGLGVYCTHSLGPLLYILEDRVTTVSAVAIPAMLDDEMRKPTMHLLHLTTEGGRTLRVRVDHTSPRPHQMAYYSLQGDRGSYEAWRGLGDRSKVWLEDEHGPSRFQEPAEWHALSEQEGRYIPDRLGAPAESRLGGHGTSEYWLLPEFMAAVGGGGRSPIDVHRALDYTLPGICAIASAEAGGAPVEVPDSRQWVRGK
jgi:predicted dehydrogenase